MPQCGDVRPKRGDKCREGPEILEHDTDARAKTDAAVREHEADSGMSHKSPPPGHRHNRRRLPHILKDSSLMINWDVHVMFVTILWFKVDLSPIRVAHVPQVATEFPNEAVYVCQAIPAGSPQLAAVPALKAELHVEPPWTTAIGGAVSRVDQCEGVR
ncbi:uncharacterized protein [Dermacentor albipictus]